MKMTSSVARNAEKDMNFWYSSEKWKDTLGADEAETICVPPCLDVLKSWKREDIDEALDSATHISGQKGEAAFMQNFKEQNMGGILVSGLALHELVASLSRRKKVKKAKKSQKSHDSEYDAIFFHQNRGIFVIEVKAIEMDDESIVSKRIEKAKSQLDTNIEDIKQSFLSLYQKECTCITGFICFPFRNEDRKTYEGYRITDKSALNDRAIFRKFFEPEATETMPDVSLLQSLAAEFVCCRSQVEFHSQAYNAMQVATWIMEQDIAQKKDPTKLINMPGNGSSGKIILTGQQLEIVECRDKCVTIRGAPGSGKTLILMLRALKAAMEHKAGSVFVFVNEKLKAKYEHFFFEERDKIFIDDGNNIIRRPKVHTIDKINFAKPEDDVFFDETPVEDSHIEKVKSRVNCSGSTTVVFTGLHRPEEAAASFLLYKPQLEQFRHFELMKVLRGTGNIFGKWEHYYPLGITIGHSIFGVAVKNETFHSFEQVQNEIANKIAILTKTFTTNTIVPLLKKEHIAVITCDDNDSISMREYLETKDIPCGQVNEQARRLKSTSMVAVDVYLSTPSYEWPIVFIVLKPAVTKEEVLPIAASRCIASLTIITYKNLQATASSIKADEQEPMGEEIFKKSNQASSVSSYSLFQSNSEEWEQKLKNVQQSLKDMYVTRFKKVYPFSLPFTFDIENTWVSLVLKEEKDSQATEDHAEVLKTAFDQVNMLIIEGEPATGKTTLMRRLAYEWAKGKQELMHYDLVLYAEFREVREETFQSIADLVLYYSKKYLDVESFENLDILINNKKFCKECRILVLLDGYDESSLEKQCIELSSYITQKTINKVLLFNTVIATRKGYLSHLRGREGRFVFAEVLGFTTIRQKETYIFKHFHSQDIDNKENIAAVHTLLNNNENLNKLAETPLFLTFICLVHERIVDGTVLELYCNTIWWLIDRYQQDFPDSDIPALFGFRNGSGDKFETIQDHFLRFPQLHCLGKMALHNLQKNVFKPSDCEQYNLQPIIEQVGLLRKEKKRDNSAKLVSSFFFTHRTIQELLAAFYCFYSDEQTSEWLLPYSKLDTSTLMGMNEFERFLLRIALSDKMPIQAEKRKYYFERIANIKLDMIFDAFTTTAGFNNDLLNRFLSQCTNVQEITLRGELNSARKGRNILNSTHTYNESAITPSTPIPTLFLFKDLIKLCSLAFGDDLSECTFEAISQQSFTNCPSLKNVQYTGCKMRSSKNLAIATLPAIDTLGFYKCTFEADSQLSFKNCSVLKNLKFNNCGIRSTNLAIATLPAIDTVELRYCNIDLTAWQSITNQISNSNVKYLKVEFREFNKEFLIHLQQCNSVEKMDITIQDYTIHQNDLLSFTDLIKLQSLTFGSHSSGCTFEANSQLSFKNCPSLNNLEFKKCEIKSSANLGIAALPEIDTVEFFKCTFDLATWQSITNQIRKSYAKCLQLSDEHFIKEMHPEFLHHLLNCEHIEQIHVTFDAFSDSLNINEEEVTKNFTKIAQKLLGLTSIIILDGKLKERNKERIEKAGQQRYSHFSIKYMERFIKLKECSPELRESLPELEEIELD